jgi:intracellular sulfur oxidation DsrE/DsrF family protein
MKISAALVAFLLFGTAHAAAPPKAHHIAVQIDVADPAVINMALNNIKNLFAAYQARNEPIEVEVVAFGPGLVMLRDDTSPVKDRLAEEHAAYPTLTFSACENTRRSMSQAEGRDVKIVSEARMVPAGVVRITDLEEQNWTYLRP